MNLRLVLGHWVAQEGHGAALSQSQWGVRWGHLVWAWGHSSRLPWLWCQLPPSGFWIRFSPGY